MAVFVALFGFVLSLVQQAGVLLGVGAELVLLVSYLAHLQTGASGPSRFTASSRAVERLGLGLIIASGFGVVFYHVLLWQPEILAAPAFIAKWVLIGVVLVGYKVERWAEEGESSWRSVTHGFIGGTWLALFLLHMLAPETSVLYLLLGYVLWMVFFTVVWSGFVTALSPNALVQFFAPKPKQTKPVAVVRETPAKVAVVAPAPVAVPKPVVVAAPAPVRVVEAPKAPPAPVVVAAAPAPVAPKVVMPAPAPKHIEPAPAPHKPVVAAAPAPMPIKAAPAPAPEPGLPKIWIMPRSPDQLPA